LQRLKGEPIFKGAEFNTLQLARAAGGDERLDFVLSSAEAPPPQASAQAKGNSAGAQLEEFLLPGADKAANFINQQLPGAKLIQKLHGGMDLPILGGKPR
jgi:hypothetical protein